jgi:hypothetical protein
MTLPTLTNDEISSLSELRRMYPVEFYSDKTAFYKREMERLIRQRMNFRISIMGITRGGKTEVASSTYYLYCRIFNKFLDEGIFDDLDLFQTKQMIKRHIEFKVGCVSANVQEYKKDVKALSEKNNLTWGQCWIIDEKKQSTGGVGSMSDMIETTNINNICAKFNQCEIWINPLGFETRNCLYGLRVEKKDMFLKLNFCLLYKIEQEPNGATMFRFLGWVSIPLHPDDEFRKEYNTKKNAWITKELSGSSDERANDRHELAKMLVKKYPHYFEMLGKKPKYNKTQLMIVINNMIIDGKIHTNYNELEKYYIVEECRMIYDGQIHEKND